MKIINLSYHEVEAEWGFENLDFFPDVSLLVGASGVGKTRILRAIRHLRGIANDAMSSPSWGIDWQTEFLDQSGNKYFWSGSFDRRDSLSPASPDFEDDFFTTDGDTLERRKPRIVQEHLLCNGKPVFVRAGDKFTLREREELHAKLSPHKSGFSILSEEDEVKPARAAISQMLFVDNHEDLNEPDRFYPPDQSLQRLTQRYCDLEQIRNSRLSTHLKLALAFEQAKDTFDDIINAFIDVFPYIEEVKIARKSYGPFADVPTIQMKEKGVSGYFSERMLSSGMRRTLMHLARLALWPDGTVILIDEFENSLGANCIDAVARQLLSYRKRLQFIVTSHHPYIINAIPMNRWKIIAREKGDIKDFTPEQLGLSKDVKHEAFLQLINTDTFKFGTLPHEPILSS